MKLQEKLAHENFEIQQILQLFATGSQHITTLFHPENRIYGNTVNTSGEKQLQMDVVADALFCTIYKQSNAVRNYASEEQEENIPMNPAATYSVTLDPLDGSSLLDANLAVGSILGIWKGDSLSGALVGAAYTVYGPTTTLVLSTGKGVHEFLLQGNDFVLVQENIQMKEQGSIYSIGGLKTKWLPEHAAFIAKLEHQGYKLRYSGGFVPDLHQILVKGGGIFSYPALTDAPDGKLRLLFELAPFAFLAEQAGGSATNGRERILDVLRNKIHQRSPIYIGSKKEVEMANMTTDRIMVVPADVPAGQREAYMKNYRNITKNTGKLFLFAGDQKIEHLNDDFYGPFDEGVIPEDDADPEHLFRIAQQANQHIGVFAAQYGLIARYGQSYPNVPYLIKMNSKSHLVGTKQTEPFSKQLVSFDDVLALKNASELQIVGVGYTVYLGSEYEHEMLAEAGRIIANAHRHGMLVVLWMYPRGKAVPDEKDAHLIAGAAGVGCCLGADFVKVNYPKKEGVASEEIFKEAIRAAGRTGVITSGGSSTDVRKFLERLHKQIHISGAVGNATGRNIHQKPLQNAVKMCAAVAAITYGNKEVDFAMKVYEGKEQF